MNCGYAVSVDGINLHGASDVGGAGDTRATSGDGYRAAHRPGSRQCNVPFEAPFATIAFRDGGRCIGRADHHGGSPLQMFFVWPVHGHRLISFFKDFSALEAAGDDGARAPEERSKFKQAAA